MHALQSQQFAGAAQRTFLRHALTDVAQLPRQQRETIDVAARGHFHFDIRNRKRHLFQIRMLTRHERAGAPTAFDHAGIGQQAEHLVDGHARTAVLRHQLVLGGHAVPGRPVAAMDALLQILADALMQGARRDGGGGGQSSGLREERLSNRKAASSGGCAVCTLRHAPCTPCIDEALHAAARRRCSVFSGSSGSIVRASADSS